MEILPLNVASKLAMIKSIIQTHVQSNSNDEAESMGLSLSHRRQFSGISVFYRILSGLAPSVPSVLFPLLLPSFCSVHMAKAKMLQLEMAT